MTPIKFNDYLSWPGDKYNFSGEAGMFGVGTRVEDTSEMGVGPFIATTTDDEHSNQFHNDDFFTERNKIARGD